MAKDMYTKLGSWIFLIGIIIAIIVGLYQAYTLETADVDVFFSTDAGGWMAWLLAIIGVIVGILTFFGEGTITVKEMPGFLIAGIALVVMGGVFNSATAATLKPLLGSLLAGVSMSLSIFVAPAIILISFEIIWVIGRDR
jgi:hypothetical protein